MGVPISGVTLEQQGAQTPPLRDTSCGCGAVSAKFLGGKMAVPALPSDTSGPKPKTRSSRSPPHTLLPPPLCFLHKVISKFNTIPKG